MSSALTAGLALTISRWYPLASPGACTCWPRLEAEAPSQSRSRHALARCASLPVASSLRLRDRGAPRRTVADGRGTLWTLVAAPHDDGPQALGDPVEILELACSRQLLGAVSPSVTPCTAPVLARQRAWGRLGWRRALHLSQASSDAPKPTFHPPTLGPRARQGTRPAWNPTPSRAAGRLRSSGAAAAPRRRRCATRPSGNCRRR